MDPIAQRIGVGGLIGISLLVIMIFFGTDIRILDYEPLGGLYIERFSPPTDSLDLGNGESITSQNKGTSLQFCAPGTFVIGIDSHGNIICGKMMPESTFEGTFVVPDTIPQNDTSFALALEAMVDEGYAFSTNLLNDNAIELNNLGNYKEAIQLYNIGLQVEPDNKRLLNNKGAALKNLSNFTGAMYYYDQALAQDMDYTFALVNKANLLDLMGETEEALKLFDKVLTIDENNIDALNNKGAVLTNLGDYEEGLKLFNKILDNNSRYWPALHGKAIILTNMEKYEAALIFYKLALQENPDSEEIQNNMQLVLDFLENRSS